MSKSCSLYVDANGRYCCTDKVFRVGDKAYTVVLANTGPVDLLVYPSGDTDEVSVVHSTLEEGSTTIIDAGTYMLGLDCEALDGTTAPLAVADQMAACCAPLIGVTAETAILCEKLESLFGGQEANTVILEAIQACLDQMKLLVAANNDATVLAEISSQLLAACDKMIANGESLKAVCDKLEKGFEQLLESSKKGEDCANPLFVEVCNPLDLTVIEGLLQDILTEAEAINENTDGLESLISDLITETQTGNATLSDILSAIDESNTLLESIDENTDGIEDLLQALFDKVYIDTEEARICLEGNLPGLLVTQYSQDDGSITGSQAYTAGGATAQPFTFGDCVEYSDQCVESQEWTYGIDNTGTNYRWPAATYQMTLSDGSAFLWQQTAAASGGWTPQMQEWGDQIQAAADAAGIKWFVETRFRDPANPANLAGGGGFAGPPSLAVSNALTNMAWRYVNIQICPGQPVPVSAQLISVEDAGGANVPALPYDLAADGAVLGPIQKFWLCTACGLEPVWYLEDGVTVAAAGQIPNCWEPCGTLALTDAPPDRDCTFEIDVACDNNNSTNTVDFTNTITRRAKLCNGEQIELQYFQADPADPTALIEYTLVGDFVDCATGEPVAVPTPPCDDFSIVELYAIEGKTPGISNREWTDLGPANAFGSDPTPVEDYLEGFDFSVAPDIDTVITASTFALNDTNNTASILDYQRRDGFICATEPLEIEFGTNSEGYIGLWLGLCGGAPQRVLSYAKGVGLERTPRVIIPAGIHRVRLDNVDWGGSNSNWTLYQVVGTATVANNQLFDALISITQPVEKCKKIKVCKPSGVFLSLLTGDVIDAADCYECSIACEASTGPQTLRVV